MLGEKIKLLRKTANLTQEEFAEKLGVSQQAIGLWERNKNLPNQKLIIKIAEIFNVTLDYLFDKNTNTDKMFFSSDEIQLIEKYRLLNIINQKNILNNIEFLLNQQIQQIDIDHILGVIYSYLQEPIVQKYNQHKIPKVESFIQDAVEYGINNQIITNDNITEICDVIRDFIVNEADGFYSCYINKKSEKELYEGFFTAIQRNLKEKKLVAV